MATPSTLQLAQQAGPKTQTQYEGSFLSYEPSQVFREELIIKNLKPYNIAGINSEPQGTVIYQQTPPDLSATEPLFSLDIAGFTVIFRNENPDNLIVPSTYLAYNILTNPNPVGNNGPLSNDSYIAKIGAQVLKKSLLETNAFFTEQNLNANTSLSFKITTSNQNDTFESKLSGSYVPDSPIPGDYFLDGLNKRPTDTAGEVLNLAAGQSTTAGGIFNGSISRIITPSQIFLEYTPLGQKGLLLSNLSYNIFRPPYGETLSSGLFNNIATTEINNLVDNFGLQLPGAYYVGSITSEPSFATNPINQVPIDAYGRDTQALVLGPDVLGKDYEGNEGSINFGLASKALIDQGNLEGDLIWVSPKYKEGNPAFYSTRIDFKPGSILDDTQRLIDAADRLQGEARLKHVGNAINQISKTFNDGYKNITKGSKVRQVSYRNGRAVVGREYCRIFTKSDTYSRYERLQKSDGITDFGRKFTYSVLNNSYNLNIYPTKQTEDGPTPSWAQGGKVKKYMFSIENLAWKDSKKPGFNVQDLPLCERGPNGGRIMWFPPYDLKFNDNSSANWQDTQFLGRPEPVYTYRSTSRNGTLSWKIVVDHPSVLNLIVDKILVNEIDSNADKVLESFFAGCQTYDLYEFAQRFNTVGLNDLQYIQEIISNASPTETKKILAEIPKTENATPTYTDVKKDPLAFPSSTYEKIGFYFNNDIPKPSETGSIKPFNLYYQEYIGQKNTFISKTLDNKDTVGKFFDDVIKYNYELTNSGTTNLITEIYDFFQKGAIVSMTINMRGCASASASVDYNTKLAERRIESVKNYLLSHKVSSGSTQISLADYKEKITIKGFAQGETATNVTTKQSGGGSQTVTSCTEDPIINGNKVTGPNSIYLLPSMACRSVFIESITTEKGPPTIERVQNPSQPTTTTDPNKKDDKITPGKQPQISEPIVELKSEKGISKKILRLLLSECNYFQAIEQTSPFIYRSLKEKLKYFEPSFHSTTPEGLNSRITFLNQCLRPGDTIPTIGTDGRPIYNDAVNTAFGRPPVLVLRIGDFYNTKIIPKTLNFSYEPLVLDTNREGIGVQPMIVGVTLSFDIIGGMGLAKPVEDLQNALSFNYYANTEIYDERAVATEDVSKLDEIFTKETLQNLDEVIAPKPVPKVENPGGTTIGEILETSNSGDAKIGKISYRKVIKEFVQDLNDYFKLVPNTSEAISKNYNFYVWQYASKDRIFKDGKFPPPPALLTPIYGKAKNLEETFGPIFTEILDSIKITADTSTIKVNEIVKNFVSLKFPDTVIKQLQDRMVQFINEKIQPNFIADLNQQLVDLNTQQQKIINTIDKLNVVHGGNSYSYDGYIKSDGTPVVYQLESAGTPLTDIKVDLDTIRADMVDYNNIITSNDIIPNTQFTLANANNIIPDNEKEFFMIMCQTFTDKNKLDEFSKYIFPSDIINDTNFTNPERPTKHLNKLLGLDFFDNFNLVFGESYYDRYRRAKNYLEKIPTNFVGGPNIPFKYKNYAAFKLSSINERKVNFTTNVADLPDGEEKLKNLYKSVPTGGEEFNGNKL